MFPLVLTTLLTTFCFDLEVGLFDELTPLYPDSTIKVEADNFAIDSPRATYAALHLLVQGVELGTPLELASTQVGTWYQLLPVPVEENTGIKSRTEQYDGKRNPDVIRTAPFEIYEVMKPITTEFIPTSDVIALRFELAIPKNATVGTKQIALHLSQNDAKVSRQFVVNIFPATVPDTGENTFSYTNWFNFDKMATFHALELSSEAHWDMVDQYAAMMQRGRQNVFWLQWPQFFSDDLVLDKMKLKAYVDRFTEAGLWWIEGAPITHRPNGDWSSPHLQLRIGKQLTHTPQGLKDLSSMTNQMMNAIDEFGWGDRWIQHIADEPTDTNAIEYAKVASIMHDSMPNIPIVEATMSRQLISSVDIWCPQVQEFQANIDFFKERQKMGDEVWTYTCLVPGGKWLNRLIDMERLRQVYFGWAASKYEITGYLHWGLNQYQADPFTQSVVDHPAMPNTTNKLPAGDTHVLYPGDGGPWSGLRFEAHRIGLEDFELLSQLKAQDEVRRDAIIEDVFRQYDEYETDVLQYRRARSALLNALP